jgi:hypothetical protein
MGESHMTEVNYQNIVNKAYQDPITALLLKNSNLSGTQFETFIIDMLIDIMSEKKVPFDEKILFRRNKVSRGSFSRSLAQARSNVISSIFTIVLLSYVGVFNSRVFDEYQFLAEKLQEYISLIDNNESGYSKEVMKSIEEELIKGIKELATPTSIKIA